jgi:hypothetical protein
LLLIEIVLKTNMSSRHGTINEEKRNNVMQCYHCTVQTKDKVLVIHPAAITGVIIQLRKDYWILKTKERRI